MVATERKGYGAKMMSMGWGHCSWHRHKLSACLEILTLKTLLPNPVMTHEVEFTIKLGLEEKHKSSEPTATVIITVETLEPVGCSESPGWLGDRWLAGPQSF